MGSTYAYLRAGWIFLFHCFNLCLYEWPVSSHIGVVDVVIDDSIVALSDSEHQQWRSFSRPHDGSNSYAKIVTRAQ